MKKIVVILSVLFFVHFSNAVFAQTGSAWEEAERERKLEEKKRKKAEKKKSKADREKDKKEVHRTSQKWDDRYDKKIGKRTRGNQVPKASSSLSNESRKTTGNKTKNRNKAKGGVPKAMKKSKSK